MPFSDVAITAVNKPTWSAGQLFLSWVSTAPAGTWYQVYVAGRLAWFGRATHASIPTPSGSRARINVGTVADGEQQTDFGSSLPSSPQDRAVLGWLGGTYQDVDLAAFRVYGEHAPGGGVDYSRPLGAVAAYPGGFVLDGWGLGGWGQGGWGYAASSYAWTSDPLTSGVWSFAIVPVDSAGNEGAASVGSVTIGVPPLPPAFYADYSRLTYTYDPADQRITLVWNPSPG